MANMIKLDAGPAKATTALPHFLSFKLYGLNGVGLPQPNHTSKSKIRPIQSTCANGFKVKRPARCAVSSPCQYPAKACANSCQPMDNNTATTHGRTNNG